MSIDNVIGMNSPQCLQVDKPLPVFPQCSHLEANKRSVARSDNIIFNPPELSVYHSWQLLKSGERGAGYNLPMVIFPADGVQFLVFRNVS